MITPLWVWQLRDERDEQLTALAGQAFGSRFDAERWLGERWRTFVEQGACSAVLRKDGAVVGAPVILDAGTLPHATN